jgi:hypothetical protein
MPRPKRGCSICHDERAQEISASLFKQGIRKTAHAFGFKYAQMARHRKHLPDAIAAERESVVREELTIDDAAPLVERAQRLLRQAERIAASARVERDWPTAIHAIREARSCLGILAELKGELTRRAGVQVAVGVSVNATHQQPTSEQDLDRLIAVRLSEITRGFDAAEIERLRLLALPPAENGQGHDA